ncbi:MAG TPA: GNAT family N-acetyltransferase [Candidatus Dormibacteraeota bacterium]|nr:GNAT family N-acetyltransferase [Candidatus Dormibacteraeota bacterium]
MNHKRSEMPQDMQVHVRNVVPEDASLWESMRRELWPEGAADHALEIRSFFAGTLREPEAVIVAETSDGDFVAFVELSIRLDLPRLAGHRVGYVEGLYVRPEIRRQGIARRLLQASRSWARQQKCTAMASDRAGRIILDRSF